MGAKKRPLHCQVDQHLSAIGGNPAPINKKGKFLCVNDINDPHQTTNLGALNRCRLIGPIENEPQIDHRNPVNKRELTCTNVTESADFC